MRRRSNFHGLWNPHGPSSPYQDTAVNGKSRFYKVDIWHTVQLGVGKDFAASAMCLLVRDICASNIDDRFQILSEKYLAWCKQFQKTKYVTKLDKKMVGGAGLRDEPLWLVEQGRVDSDTLGVFGALLRGKQRDSLETWGFTLSIPASWHTIHQQVHANPLPPWHVDTCQRG